MPNELELLQADLRKLRSQLAVMDNVVGRMESRIAELSFKQLVRTETQTKVILEQFRETALDEFSITLNEFMSAARYSYLQPARQLFCLAAVRQSVSFSEISRFLNRDHSTIIYSCKKAVEIMQKDPRLIVSYERIVQSIQREVKAS